MGDGFGDLSPRTTVTSPSAPAFNNRHGPVYLYDGVTTGNQTVSNFVYGSLLHVFADPNPEPGDEFGASLAVVGNELVVGVPASSLPTT